MRQQRVGRRGGSRRYQGEDWRRQHQSRFQARQWTPRRRAAPPAPLLTRTRFALLLALIELGVLVWLLASPAFKARQVEVDGTVHLDAAQVRAAAGADRSVFVLDGDTMRHDLLHQPWIRDAQVQVLTSGRVVIRVQEWEPVATYRAGLVGPAYFISSQAIALGPAPAGESLLEIEGPASPQPKPGQPTLDRHLLTTMVNIQRLFPRLVGQGQEVKGFGFDSCGNLDLVTRRGWWVEFGRVLTAEEYVELKTKLGNLQAYAASADLNSPRLRAVRLHSPDGVVVEEASPAPAPQAILPCR